MTPGEWQSWPQDENNVAPFAVSARESDGSRRFVAFVQNDDDARLIAAVPNLLVALEEVARLLGEETGPSAADGPAYDIAVAALATVPGPASLPLAEKD